MDKKTPSLSYSILKLKCPKCRKGNLFCHSNSFNFKTILDMPEKCENCNQDFVIETGFYYGAMYVSYGLSIALIVAIFTVLNVLTIFSIPAFLITTLVALVIAMPSLARISRAIWISFMVKYDAKSSV